VHAVTENNGENLNPDIQLFGLNKGDGTVISIIRDGNVLGFKTSSHDREGKVADGHFTTESAGQLAFDRRPERLSVDKERNERNDEQEEEDDSRGDQYPLL